MAIRISKSDAARLGIAAPKGAKRGPKKETPPPLWSAWGIPEPMSEFRFCERRWRFDFAWGIFAIGFVCGMPLMLRTVNVAIEIDGGVWIQGRHSRGKGQIEDMAKLNRAAVLGWRVLRCTPQQLESGAIMPTIKQALGI